MNKDQFKGTVKEVAGKVQETSGKLLGSADQQARSLPRSVRPPQGDERFPFAARRSPARDAAELRHGAEVPRAVIFEICPPRGSPRPRARVRLKPSKTRASQVAAPRALRPMFDSEHIPQSRLTQIKEDADRVRYNSDGVRCVALFAASRVERLVTSKGEGHELGNHSADCSGPGTDRCRSDLALQPQLGLRAQRGARVGGGCSPGAIGVGSPVGVARNADADSGR